ncbi:unnamed protein product [Ambrosiozyma monospora]|uniref:Unnamed protein product n=1 Tax=Ambrosiozyma monospora TaxID=43982 RepID=A0ACB5T9L3_AMBMO|nr:unnamed protein product [Ambrosiozyma monospora]
MKKVTNTHHELVQVQKEKDCHLNDSHGIPLDYSKVKHVQTQQKDLIDFEVLPVETQMLISQFLDPSERERFTLITDQDSATNDNNGTTSTNDSTERKQRKRKYPLVDNDRARKRRARQNREREKAEGLFHLFEDRSAESTASTSTTVVPSVESSSRTKTATRRMTNPFIDDGDQASSIQLGSNHDDDGDDGAHIGDVENGTANGVDNANVNGTSNGTPNEASSYTTTVTSTQTSPGFGVKRRKKFRAVRAPPLAAFKLHRASFANYNDDCWTSASEQLFQFLKKPNNKPVSMRHQHHHMYPTSDLMIEVCCTETYRRDRNSCPSATLKFRLAPRRAHLIFSNLIHDNALLAIDGQSVINLKSLSS